MKYVMLLLVAFILLNGCYRQIISDCYVNENFNIKDLHGSIIAVYIDGDPNVEGLAQPFNSLYDNDDKFKEHFKNELTNKLKNDMIGTTFKEASKEEFDALKIEDCIEENEEIRKSSINIAAFLININHLLIRYYEIRGSRGIEKYCAINCNVSVVDLANNLNVILFAVEGSSTVFFSDYKTAIRQATSKCINKTSAYLSLGKQKEISL